MKNREIQLKYSKGVVSSIPRDGEGEAQSRRSINRDLDRERKAQASRRTNRNKGRLDLDITFNLQFTLTPAHVHSAYEKYNNQAISRGHLQLLEAAGYESPGHPAGPWRGKVPQVLQNAVPGHGQLQLW